MIRAFPDAPIYTSLYDPMGTFPEFRQFDVRPMSLNRIGLLRAHHRLGLPILASAFSRLRVEADVVLCSSSGWAHGVEVQGRKIVYCHAPARWLYQPDRYLSPGSRVARSLLSILRPRLVAWDQRAAASADGYLANSTAVAARVLELYDIRAEIVHPPHTLDPTGDQAPVPGVESGFFLCVSRLLPYKNVDVVAEAFRDLDERLVVVGGGPEEARLRAAATQNVQFLGRVDDAQLRWLYANCAGLVASSYEDYGLTPVEAAAFGKPAAVLRWGGFLDTTDEGVSGIFFDEPTPQAVNTAVRTLVARRWDVDTLRLHASRFSEAAFVEHLQRAVIDDGSQTG